MQGPSEAGSKFLTWVNETLTQKRVAHPQQRAFAEQESPERDVKERRIQTEREKQKARQDVLNKAMSKLALEAVAEVTRMNASDSKLTPDTKHTVWSIAGLFRSLKQEEARQESESKPAGSIEGAAVPYADRGKVIGLNQLILSVASIARSDLDTFEKYNASPEDIRSIFASADSMTRSEM